MASTVGISSRERRKVNDKGKVGEKIWARAQWGTGMMKGWWPRGHQNLGLLEPSVLWAPL